MLTNEEHIEKLRQMLCEASCCDAQCASDFVVMANYVLHRTHETVGVNTLKRLFHYGSEYSEPRLQTLNVLSRAIGYRSYDDFRLHYESDVPSSDIVLGPHISSASLPIGTHICLRWAPGRECVAEYLGNNTYRVLSSQRTKLTPGDTFQSPFFALGHAALLSNLVHGDTSFPLYEIGKQGGLTLTQVMTR